MTTHFLRIFGSLMALSICFWGVFLRPRRLPPPALVSQEVLSMEEAAYLQERTAKLMRANRQAEALPLLQKTLAAFPNNPVYLSKAAEIQHQLGHYQEEAELWERYLKVAPTPGSAFPDLGNAYRKLGQPRVAEDAFARAVALEPRNVEFRFFYGRACEDAGDYGQARKAYQEACAMHPDDPDSRAGWGRMEVFGGHPRQALLEVDQVLARNPDNVDALLVEGMALRQEGKYLQAQTALSHGLSLSPRYGDFMLVLAGVQKALGHPKEAALLLARWQALDPAAHLPPARWHRRKRP